MSKIILDTEDFFQNDGYDDLMHIDHESYCCGEMFEKYETKISDLEAKLKALQNGIVDDETLNMLVKEHKLYKDLEAKLAEKDKAIENWQIMYESVVQTCHNDKEEIERLNKRLETQENTITNIVEDNRASQEWYKKQLEEKEKERHEEWKTGKEWKWEWQKVNQKLEKADQDKISFCIEQLEKVKSAFGLINSKLDKVETIKEYIHYIDHQINELKGKVE